MVIDHANREDREQLLASLLSQLGPDDRVRAAWLAGSLGRGSADDLSDIDLWLAVSDDLLAEVITAPVEWVRSRCDTTLAFSIPQNAPAGGAYVFSLVRCPHGLQQVDWYWAPATSIERPSETSAVFERDPIPVAGTPPTLEDQECRDLTVFWCREALGMAHISTKRIQRGNSWIVAGHLRQVADCAGNARWIQQHLRAPAHDDPRDISLPAMIPTSRSDQFHLLLDLLTQLDPVFSGLPDRDRTELVQTRDAIRDAIDRSLHKG
jgi:hypothetical protein